MPFRTLITPFTGDGSIASFLANQWLTFARDDCGWTDNLAPSPGSNPYELWINRGGSDAQPYVFFRGTTSELSIFTGTGVDTMQEIYDQPGNPCNAPNAADFSDLTASPQRQKHQLMCGLTPASTFSAFWLFAPDDCSYIHCVLKVAPRHYRHWWVGKLVPMVDGIDPTSFYVCGHFWDRQGGVTMSGLTNANNNRAPYASEHRPPHGCYGGSTALDSIKYQHASQFYMPGLRSSIDWWCSENSSLGTVAVTKAVGDVVTAKTLGFAQVAGYGRSMGAGLFQCDASFTAGTVPLIPVMVFGSFSFEGAERIGPLCRIPDVFRVNMRQFVPEQEILVGSYTYQLFPLTNQDSANIQAGEPYSGYEGIAYRKFGSS